MQYVIKPIHEPPKCPDARTIPHLAGWPLYSLPDLVLYHLVCWLAGLLVCVSKLLFALCTKS